MRRFCLLPLLLICCLTLTACSRSRSEEAVRDFAVRVTVLAPELIQGISAHVSPGSTTLEYDTVVLDTGSLDSLGLSPLSSLPAAVRAMRLGHIDSVWEEDGRRVAQFEPDDQLRCTVWFEKDAMRPVRAELMTDGRVTVYLEFRDWSEGPGAPEAAAPSPVETE